MEKEDILSIHKCHCSRPYCDYFYPCGEWGRSMTKKEVKELLQEQLDNKEVIKHLKNLLKK